MKIRMIQSTVQELEVDIPDEFDSLMNVMEESNRLAKEGKAKPLGESRDLGCQVVSVVRTVDGKEVVLMVHRLGQIVVTEEGGLHFTETRDATLAQQQALKDAAARRQLDEEQRAPSEKTN